MYSKGACTIEALCVGYSHPQSIKEPHWQWCAELRWPSSWWRLSINTISPRLPVYSQHTNQLNPAHREQSCVDTTWLWAGVDRSFSVKLTNTTAAAAASTRGGDPSDGFGPAVSLSISSTVCPSRRGLLVAGRESWSRGPEGGVRTRRIVGSCCSQTIRTGPPSSLVSMTKPPPPGINFLLNLCLSLHECFTMKTDKRHKDTNLTCS